MDMKRFWFDIDVIVKDSFCCKAETKEEAEKLAIKYFENRWFDDYDQGDYKLETLNLRQIDNIEED